MDRYQYLRKCVTALIIVTVLSIPGIGKAQSVTITSMADVTCVGAGNCSQLRFAINLSGLVDPARVQLLSNNTSLWSFDGLVGVSTLTGTALPWSSTVNGGGITVESSGPWPGSIIYVTTRMGNYSGFGSLFNGSLGYDVQEIQEPPPTPTESTVGTEDVTGTAIATPEPGTILLLGTGLASIFGATRRRRREGVTPS